MNKKRCAIVVTLAIGIWAAFFMLHYADGSSVINNIQPPSTTNLLALSAKMNTPEWSDILLEVTEWAAVAGVTYLTYGLLAEVAVSIKWLRNAKKAKVISTATAQSYEALKKIIKPFFKARARPFNRNAISYVKQSSGIYLFFNKKGEVKYVGKAVNLKQRIYQHFNGSGNALLNENSKQLSFITIPIPAVGSNKGAISCMEAIAINAFNNGSLYNKRIEKINKADCRQLVMR